MRTFWLALLVVAASASAQGAECIYRSSDGWTFTIEDKSENEYRVTHPDGVSTVCTWMQTDQGTGVRLSCDDSTEEFVTPEDNGDLTFGERTYVKECR